MTIVRPHPRQTSHRRNRFWIAAMVHRLSGILLACFLPLHFLALGLALEQTAQLDRFLRWTEQPVVKLAETGLIFLLTVHLLGGIRILLIETLPWYRHQKRVVGAVVGTAGVVAMLFVLLML